MNKLIDAKLVNIPWGNDVYCLRLSFSIGWKSIISMEHSSFAFVWT